MQDTGNAINPCGLVVSIDFPHIASSPDRKVTNDLTISYVHIQSNNMHPYYMYILTYNAFLGRRPTIQRLLPTAIPTVITWTKPESASSAKRKSRAVERENKKAKFDERCLKSLEKTF
jgi:hypothetical protein